MSIKISRTAVCPDFATVEDLHLGVLYEDRHGDLCMRAHTTMLLYFTYERACVKVPFIYDGTKRAPFTISDAIVTIVNEEKVK